MKHFLSLALHTLLFTISTFSQTNYYVDATLGNDTNNGLLPAAAWQT